MTHKGNHSQEIHEPSNYATQDSHYTHNYVEYLNSQSMKLVDNDVCRYYPEQYHDMFSWTPNAELKATYTDGVTEQQLWTYRSRSSKGDTIYSLLAEGQTPISLNVTVQGDRNLHEEIRFVVGLSVHDGGMETW